MTKSTTTTLLIVCAIVQNVQAENWQSLTGSATLEKLVSGATAEIHLESGVIAIGKYDADGSARVEAWNETFERSWFVSGDDQVCYSSSLETNCFSYEQNQDDTRQYRSRNIRTGEIVNFRVKEGESGNYTSEIPVDSDGGMGSPSASEIAAALADPNTTLGTMNFQFDHIQFDGDIPGADKADAQRMVFQPSLPYSLTETTNLFIRPAFPVIFNQDVPNPDGSFSSKGTDLGDISFDAAFATTYPGGYVVLAGLTGTLPTATDDALGLDQWLLGPEAALAMIRPWGVVGVLVTHQWDIAGEDDFDTSITGGQYFYTINLEDGWQINGSPTFSYNHEADSGNELTFPIAVGASKTTIIGGRPWKFGLQYWHFVESPDDFGPEDQIRFSISPVVKLPW